MRSSCREPSPQIEEGHRVGVALPLIESLPWIQVRTATKLRLPFRESSLGSGELQTLAIARQMAQCLVILDDAAARSAAQRLGLRVTGTLGVLLRAKKSGLIPMILPLVTRLEATGFRLDPVTRSAVLRLAEE